jgi:GST-like protein
MIDLYALTSPNVRKIYLMLEELELPYTEHFVDVWKGDNYDPDFRKLNPNGKIPVIVDHDGPGGRPYTVFESGAILLYLADKTGRLMAADPARRYETIQWVMFQVGGIGPMFGQVGFFHKFAGKEFEDKRPRDRYVGEAKRLLGVLEGRLADRPWVMGDDYSIADIAIFPWVRNLVGFYGAGELVGIDSYPQVQRALAAFVARPAVQAGLLVPKAESL